METTRQEHLDWCKQRALKYVEMGEVDNAYMSFLSDMGKHPETAKHVGLTLGFQLQLSGHLGTPSEMKTFIEGFH